MSSSSDLLGDLGGAAAALMGATVSSRELVVETLRWIDRWNPQVAALTDVLAEPALAAADRIDRRRKDGAMLSPLAGVPVAVKDIIDTTPAVCSAGLPFLRDYRPPKDASVVRRLRNAGAIVIGVSATDPGAFGVKTPDVTHPQAPERSVGGSSGGSGAALAAGFCGAAIGTDTGGSIRIPAACCLVSGLMPSYGRVSTQGVRPLSPSADHVGPMTRRVRDLATVARILDPGFERTATRVGRDRPVIGHAPGYWRDADPEIRLGMKDALTACEAIGAGIREVSLPSPDEAMEFHVVILATEAADYHFQNFPDRLEDYPPVAKSLLSMAREQRGYDYVRAIRRRDAARQRVAFLFEEVDFLIVPTLPVLPPLRLAKTVRVGNAELDFTLALIRYTCLFDHTGNPVVSLPARLLGPGMGASAQVVGPRNSDARLLDFASRLEEALDVPEDYAIRLTNDSRV